MAFTHVESKRAFGGTGTTATVTLDAAPASGDLVVAWVHHNADGSTISPSGTVGASWTELRQQGVSGETMRYALYWKVAGASEPTSYSFSWGTSTRYSAFVRVFRPDTGTPALDAGPAAATTGITASPTISSITVSDNAVAVAFIGADNTQREPSAVDSSYTGLLTFSVGEGTLQDSSSAYRIFTTGGSTGTVGFTMASSEVFYSEHVSFVEGGASDTTPDAFSFTDQAGVALSTLTESNDITVAGIDAAAAISISGGSAEYRINAGSWTSGAGTVNNGDTVRLRLTSSASYSTAVTTTLTIGGVTDTWSVTTTAFPNIRMKVTKP